jgi:gas vesicle protein
MDPKTIIPAAIIGAVIGVAAGYTVASLSKFATFGFMIWAGLDSQYANFSHAGDALAWTIGGAIVGAAGAFLLRPNSN